MNAPNVHQIIKIMTAKEYSVFSNASGHDLNIVGIRTDDQAANSFNDWLNVFYIFAGVWNFFSFPATTDPGLYYRENPINVKGTAVMKPGQYPGAYMVGKHKGYKALQQKGNITVFRDADRDSEIATGGNEDTGLHACNIHHANAHRPSVQVDKWSAGCQVLQDPDHHAFLMVLCERARAKYGNSFTYNLLEESDFNG